MWMNRPYLLFGLLVAASFSPAAAQTQQLDRLLAGLNAPDPAVRIEAFYELMNGGGGGVRAATADLMNRYPYDRDRVAVALITLLEREDARLHLDPPMMSARDGEYYGDLVEAVVSLKDARAVRALLPAITTGKMAQDGLAALGDAALPGVITVLQSPDGSPRMRRAAAEVLGTMVGQRSEARLGPASPKAIESALLKALSDEDGDVREAAVNALMPFDDAEVRSAIVTLARKDPYQTKRGGQTVFPVRQAARVWLARHGS